MKKNLFIIALVITLISVLSLTVTQLTENHESFFYTSVTKSNFDSNFKTTIPNAPKMNSYSAESDNNEDFNSIQMTPTENKYVALNATPVNSVSNGAMTYNSSMNVKTETSIQPQSVQPIFFNSFGSKNTTSTSSSQLAPTADASVLNSEDANKTSIGNASVLQRCYSDCGYNVKVKKVYYDWCQNRWIEYWEWEHVYVECPNSVPVGDAPIFLTVLIYAYVIYKFYSHKTVS